MTALAAAVREFTAFSPDARRQRRNHVRAAGVTLVVGGSAVFIAHRSGHWRGGYQLVSSRGLREREEMMKRLQTKLFHAGASRVRPIDRRRLKRLYEAQLQQPMPGPRETYDEIIAGLR